MGNVIAVTEEELVDLYVVIDKKNPDRLYYNEMPDSADNELMSLEEATYTADWLGCQVYKLVPIEDD